MSLETASATLRPAPGRENPLAEWVSTTDRNALPNVLDWASESPRPPINGRVDVIRFGIALGTGTVAGYFHRNGELGVIVELDSVPATMDLPEGTRRAHFYGENITRLDQGDEPTEDVADNADVQDVPVYKADVAPAGDDERGEVQLEEQEGHGAEGDDDEKITL